MLYRFARVVITQLFRLLFRFKAIGVSNIPKEGPVVLASNHKSVIDPVTLGVGSPRKIHYMAKEELFRIPLFNSLIRALGAFPVKRGGVSKEAIRTALKVLGEAKVMGIFPEGTRKGNRIDGVAEGKRGAISMAARARAAVVPVAIVGEYKLFRKLTMVVGEPLDLSEFLEKGNEDWDGATEKLMSAIRELHKTGRR